jgi:hypothetical protein
MSAGKSFVQDSVVAEYYATGFLRDLIRTGQLTRKETPSDNTARFAAYHGAEHLPAELASSGASAAAEWRRCGSLPAVRASRRAAPPRRGSSSLTTP